MRSAVKTGHRVRTLGAGLALAACALLTTGCGEDSVAETVKEAVQTPQQKLVDAAPTTTTDPYVYTITQKGAPDDASDSKGVVNAPAKAYELTTVTKDAELGYTLTLDFRVVDQKSWIKVKFENADDLGLPEIPKKWMALDAAKVKAKETVPLKFEDQDEDPARLGPLFTSIVDATEAGGGKYTGTLDYTQQTTTQLLSAETVKALGEKAKALPFTATVTDGKVTEFVLSVPAAGATKAQTLTAVYDYAQATPLVAPTAAEISETPNFVYELING
jgi:hypothetical protein